MAIGLAHSYEVTGQPRSGLDQAEAAVEAARLSSNSQVLCWALTAEAWIAAIAGELERARTAGAEALELLGDLDESVLSRATRVHVAAAELEAGEPERCVEAMADAGGPEFVHVEPGRRAWLYSILARAELSLGHTVVAEDWVARGERLAQTLDLGYVEGAVAYARALIQLDRGDARRAGGSQTVRQARTDAGAAVQASRARIGRGVLRRRPVTSRARPPGWSGPRPSWRRWARSASVTRRHASYAVSAGVWGRAIAAPKAVRAWRVSAAASARSPSWWRAD